ncbi:hypothetical protein ACJX0J_037127, partial [Zea mays]
FGFHLKMQFRNGLTQKIFALRIFMFYEEACSWPELDMYFEYPFDLGQAQFYNISMLILFKTIIAYMIMLTFYKYSKFTSIRLGNLLYTLAMLQIPSIDDSSLLASQSFFMPGAGTIHVFIIIDIVSVVKDNKLFHVDYDMWKNLRLEDDIPLDYQYKGRRDHIVYFLSSSLWALAFLFVSSIITTSDLLDEAMILRGLFRGRLCLASLNLACEWEMAKMEEGDELLDVFWGYCAHSIRFWTMNHIIKKVGLKI